MAYERATLGLRRKQELYDLATELGMKPSILCDVLISVGDWLMHQQLDELDGRTLGSILAEMFEGGEPHIKGRDVRLIDNALFVYSGGDTYRRLLKP
jgi:hypothetical protein